MGDELKVVNPPEILAYGKRLNTNIDSITTEANGLIADVTNVDYHGTNAFKLKTDANNMTEQFAKDMFQRVSTLSSQRVVKATSSISGALGGHVGHDQPREQLGHDARRRSPTTASRSPTRRR